jgi:hypothetical protein
MHSTNYLYPLRQTIYRMLQNAKKEHNFRVNVVDICQASGHAAPLHTSFPFQLPTSHLKDNTKEYSKNKTGKILLISVPVGQ